MELCGPLSEPKDDAIRAEDPGCMGNIVRTTTKLAGIVIQAAETLCGIRLTCCFLCELDLLCNDGIDPPIIAICTVTSG